MVSNVASVEHSHISGRNMRPLDNFNAAQYASLAALGIGLPEHRIQDMLENHVRSFGMDSLPAGLTTSSIAVPVQFLQTWLPGFVFTFTAARNIDELIGISVVGDWKDEEIILSQMELDAIAVPYSDYGNVPFSTWNPNFYSYTVVRFEQGMRVGVLEEGRAGAIRTNSAANKRTAATNALEIQRNLVGFYGYNGGNNSTYGFLNSTGLPAYVEVATGALGFTWSVKTFLEITNDLRTAFSALRTQTLDRIDPTTQETTLALATATIDYLSTTTDLGYSVRQWLTETYPKCRVVSAPELDAAHSGDNVFYLYADEVKDDSTDDRRVFQQAVQNKFMIVGVQQLVKGYQEAYSNATAGVVCKRPIAVVRYYNN